MRSNNISLEAALGLRESMKTKVANMSEEILRERLNRFLDHAAIQHVDSFSYWAQRANSPKTKTVMTGTPITEADIDIYERLALLNAPSLEKLIEKANGLIRTSDAIELLGVIPDKSYLSKGQVRSVSKLITLLGLVRKSKWRDGKVAKVWTDLDGGKFADLRAATALKMIEEFKLTNSSPTEETALGAFSSLF